MMKILSGVAIATWLTWGVCSFTEVVTNNLTPNYEYSDANLFKLIANECSQEVTTEETTEPTTESIIKESKKERECLGVFKITAYCPCQRCSEGYGRQTATGARATAGRTIAVDPSIIPYGTQIEINGHKYIAEDCGGDIKGNRIDIFFDTHSETLEWGVRSCNVYK